MKEWGYAYMCLSQISGKLCFYYRHITKITLKRF